MSDFFEFQKNQSENGNEDKCHKKIKKTIIHFLKYSDLLQSEIQLPTYQASEWHEIE